MSSRLRGALMWPLACALLAAAAVAGTTAGALLALLLATAGAGF